MRKTGSEWEAAVETWLRKAGLRPLARNYFCRYGEIDLIMRDGDCVVFIESRYRNTGDGLASVGASKRVKLQRTASMFLQANPAFANAPCRFDVVGCRGTPNQPVFDWVKGAFDADGNS
jgi:putative endonuclease